MSTIPPPGGTPPSQPTSVPQAASVPQTAPSGAPFYYQTTAPHTRRGFWGKLFLTFLVLALGGSFLMNVSLLAMFGGLLLDGTPRVQEKYVSHSKTAQDKVVILPIEGVILE